MVPALRPQGDEAVAHSSIGTPAPGGMDGSCCLRRGPCGCAGRYSPARLHKAVALWLRDHLCVCQGHHSPLLLPVGQGHARSPQPRAKAGADVPFWLHGCSIPKLTSSHTLPGLSGTSGCDSLPLSLSAIHEGFPSSCCMPGVACLLSSPWSLPGAAIPHPSTLWE